MKLDDALTQLRDMKLPWEIHMQIRAMLESVSRTSYEYGQYMGRDYACDRIQTLVDEFQHSDED